MLTFVALLVLALAELLSTLGSLFYPYLQSYFPFTYFFSVQREQAFASLPFPFITITDVLRNPLDLVLWRAGASHGLTLLTLETGVLYSLYRYRVALTFLNTILVVGVHEGIWIFFWYLEYFQRARLIQPNTDVLIFSSVGIIAILYRLHPKIRKRLTWFLVGSLAAFALWYAFGYPVSYTVLPTLFYDYAVNAYENFTWVWVTVLYYALIAAYLRVNAYNKSVRVQSRNVTAQDKADDRNDGPIWGDSVH